MLLKVVFLLVVFLLYKRIQDLGRRELVDMGFKESLASAVMQSLFICPVIFVTNSQAQELTHFLRQPLQP